MKILAVCLFYISMASASDISSISRQSESLISCRNQIKKTCLVSKSATKTLCLYNSLKKFDKDCRESVERLLELHALFTDQNLKRCGISRTKDASLSGYKLTLKSSSQKSSECKEKTEKLNSTMESYEQFLMSQYGKSLDEFQFVKGLDLNSKTQSGSYGFSTVPHGDLTPLVKSCLAIAKKQLSSCLQNEGQQLSLCIGEDKFVVKKECDAIYMSIMDYQRLSLHRLPFECRDETWKDSGGWILWDELTKISPNKACQNLSDSVRLELQKFREKSYKQFGVEVVRMIYELSN